MSISISWVAVKGVSKDAVLEALGLVDSGDVEDPDDLPECAWTELPGGWQIVAATEFDCAEPEYLAALSAGGLAIGFQISEVVMVSTAYGYEDGREVWSVVHDPDVDVDDIEVTGNPPAQLAGIRAELKRLKAEDTEGGVDYVFDAPAALSAALCGYRPDETPEGMDEPIFMTLEPVGRAAPEPVRRATPERTGQGGGGFLRWLGGLFGKG
jgi:hypothetical protein